MSWLARGHLCHVPRLAREASAKSVVLLKNNGILPLSPPGRSTEVVQSIAVIGPFAVCEPDDVAFLGQGPLMNGLHSLECWICPCAVYFLFPFPTTQYLSRHLLSSLLQWCDALTSETMCI